MKLSGIGALLRVRYGMFLSLAVFISTTIYAMAQDVAIPEFPLPTGHPLAPWGAAAVALITTVVQMVNAGRRSAERASYAAHDGLLQETKLKLHTYEERLLRMHTDSQDRDHKIEINMMSQVRDLKDYFAQKREDERDELLQMFRVMFDEHERRESERIKTAVREAMAPRPPVQGGL